MWKYKETRNFGIYPVPMSILPSLQNFDELPPVDTMDLA